MDYIEVSGKTVDEALTNALLKLETTSDNIEYEVVEKGSTGGLLGLFKSKPAVIRVRKKKDDNTDIDIEAIKETVSVNTNLGNLKTSDVKDNEKSENSKPALAAASAEEVTEKINNFLGDMFKAMDMDVKVKVNFNEKESSANIELTGDNMGVLIGKRGQTLDSIQYLVSLVINKGKEKYVKVKVDTENYRSRRKETLESLARNIAYRVKRSKRSVSLEPMNPYERRIIHSALQNDKFVSTRSEGEEPFRHVVVFLDKEKSANRYDR